MEVRSELYGYQMQIYVPLLMWNTIRMERTHESGSLDWGHFRISRPVWVWDGTWIEFRCTSWDLHQVRCDWELKCYSIIQHLGERRTGWRWITKIGTWLGWDANILYWMDVKLCMDGGETIIMRPGCWRGRTWMDLRCTSWDLYGFEMGSECSWDIVITICMELRLHLDEGEARILEPVFRWDSTWMEMRHKSSKLDWLGVVPGWNWLAVFRTGMEVIQAEVASSTNIGTLMVHRWRWYKNIGTSMLVTQDLEWC